MALSLGFQSTKRLIYVSKEWHVLSHTCTFPRPSDPHSLMLNSTEKVRNDVWVRYREQHLQHAGSCESYSVSLNPGGPRRGNPVLPTRKWWLPVVLCVPSCSYMKESSPRCLDDGHESKLSIQQHCVCKCLTITHTHKAPCYFLNRSV